MTCPACGRSVRASDVQCPACGVTLFAPPADAGGDTAQPDMELVPILRTEDYGLLPILRSMLDAEGIDHVVRGGASRDLFAFLRGAAGSAIPGGPTEIVVRAEDAPRARALLHDLKHAELPDDWDPESEQ